MNIVSGWKFVWRISFSCLPVFLLIWIEQFYFKGVDLKKGGTLPQELQEIADIYLGEIDFSASVNFFFTQISQYIPLSREEQNLDLLNHFTDSLSKLENIFKQRMERHKFIIERMKNDNLFQKDILLAAISATNNKQNDLYQLIKTVMSFYHGHYSLSLSKAEIDGAIYAQMMNLYRYFSIPMVKENSCKMTSVESVTGDDEDDPVVYYIRKTLHSFSHINLAQFFINSIFKDDPFSRYEDNQMTAAMLNLTGKGTAQLYGMLLPDRKHRVAKITIKYFYHNITNDLISFINQNKIDALIVDLRSSVGGLIDEAMAIASLFVHHQSPLIKIFYKDKDNYLEVDYVKSKRISTFFDFPLAILIDKDSASAAEVLAAILQDHQRAVVIGERSMGKYYGQYILPVQSFKGISSLFKEKGELIISHFYFVRSNGYTLNLGVYPDIDMQIEEDDRRSLPQFKIAHLANQEKQRKKFDFKMDVDKLFNNSSLAMQSLNDLAEKYSFYILQQMKK